MVLDPLLPPTSSQYPWEVNFQKNVFFSELSEMSRYVQKVIFPTPPQGLGMRSSTQKIFARNYMK